MCLKKWLFKSAVIFVFLFFPCSCARRTENPPQALASATETRGGVIDALGRRYAQNETPRRIVSLSPAVTEILFAIGAGDEVVGVTQYCDYPPEAKTKTSVGGFSGATMSMELIRVLEPDLVILSADMHGRIVSLLDELGISSFAVEPGNFSEVYGVIALLGEISGCSAGADKVIAEMKAKIAGVEERVRGQEKRGVFWILSEDPLMTAGRDTFISEAISLAGGRNIFDDVPEQWPLVSPEQVLLRKPEWILIGSDMAVSGQIFSGSAVWKTIPAVREGRLAFVDGDLLYRYGPRLADAVALLAEIFYPHL